MQNKWLMFSLIMFIAVFAVVGHMPVLAADSNDTNKSGGSSDDDSDDNETEDDKDGDSDDENETEDDEDDDKEGQKDNDREGNVKDDGKEGYAWGFGPGGRFGQNCTVKVEKEIEVEDGKRVQVLKKWVRCADGTNAEFELKIENQTAGGKYKEKMKYKFEGKDLEVEAEDEIDLEEEANGTEYQLRARLRDGNHTRIKIMPDTASEIALERLKALNFTIQLRERIHNNVPQVVYNIEANKNGKFLGVFKLAMKVNAEVDPETGELLDVNMPWWAFLVSGDDEEVPTDTNETDDNGTGIEDTFLEGTVNESENDSENAAA